MDNRLNILYAENIDQFHKEVWNRKYVKLNEDTINRYNKNFLFLKEEVSILL